MKQLKTLLVSFSLVFLLATTAFGGKTDTSPCVPGETSSPPCSAAQLTTDDPVVPQTQTDTQPAADLFDLTSVTADTVTLLLLF